MSVTYNSTCIDLCVSVLDSYYTVEQINQNYISLPNVTNYMTFIHPYAQSFHLSDTKFDPEQMLKDLRQRLSCSMADDKVAKFIDAALLLSSSIRYAWIDLDNHNHCNGTNGWVDSITNADSCASAIMAAQSHEELNEQICDFDRTQDCNGLHVQCICYLAGYVTGKFGSIDLTSLPREYQKGTLDPYTNFDAQDPLLQTIHVHIACVAATEKLQADVTFINILVNASHHLAQFPVTYDKLALFVNDSFDMLEWSANIMNIADILTNVSLAYV